MDITSSTSSTRFRFRDHSNHQQIMLLNQDSNAEELSHTSTDTSSVSSDCNEESELESMTAKGISHLCSELIELKNESDEDFQKIIFSNYSAFLRIFQEMEGLESEMRQLKYQASTQQRLIKDITERISLRVLSEQVMESMVEENSYSEPSSLSIIEAHTEDVSEILDTLLSEHRLEEALSALEMEALAFQSMQYEQKISSDELMSYNSAISEKKAMLTDQLTLLAKNPRASPAELQTALVGLCKLSNSPLATELLFNYYHTRIALGIHDLQSSQVSLHELYSRELAKFVFSMISQAAKSFVALHGEAHTEELIQWASGETEFFAACLDKYIRSISEISDGLSTAVEAVQYAVSYCSLLETQKVVLRSCLIDYIRPCMEQELQIHLDHHKKVIGIFTSTDDWILGSYIVSGILSKGSSFTVVDQKPEYCLLTNSGRKFVTLFQAITNDSVPLVALQMEGSILRGLMDLFNEYMAMLERALATGAMQKGGLRINLAQSLVQGVSVIADSSTLLQFFSDIVRDVFGDLYHLKFEIDNFVLFIQDIHVRLRSQIFEHVILQLLSPEGDQGHVSESYIELQDGSDTCSPVPSVPYQEFYLELRKLQKFAEDKYIELDWLTDLLRDLMEAILVRISSRKDIFIVTEDNSTQLTSSVQLILDIQFLVEIARGGGHLSNNILNGALDIVARIKSALSSTQFIQERHVNADGWAMDAAIIAIQKLEELEERESVTGQISENLKEETNEYESQNSSDLFEDDNASVYSNQSKDSAVGHSSEMSSHAERNISEKEDTSLTDIDLGRDENNLRILEAETFVREAFEEETSSPLDHIEQELKIEEEEDLRKSANSGPSTAGDIDAIQNCHEDASRQKIDAVQEED